tara:strand:- start:1689 stop:1982 length:294 start_codon:yes stop_codon:yes gene_type:complete
MQLYTVKNIKTARQLGLTVAWITEERAILKRDETTLNSIIESLQHNTSEIDTLISKIRDNLSKRQAAYTAGDWSDYIALRASELELFEELDWLMANL